MGEGLGHKGTQGFCLDDEILADRVCGSGYTAI